MIPIALQYTPRLSPDEKQLIELPNRLRNLRPLMQRVIAPRFVDMETQWFESQGSAFGRTGWAPLAESTIESKRRRGTLDKGILRDTDHLFRVLVRERSTDSRLRAIPGGLRFVFNVGVPYAIYHQVGTSRMPERQVIPYPLPPSFIRGIRAAVRAFILTGRIASAG